jgi:hypothetical protein
MATKFGKVPENYIPKLLPQYKPMFSSCQGRMKKGIALVLITETDQLH